MNKQIQFLDTTLRDGEQTPGLAFRDYEKLTVAMNLLDKTKVDALEVGSARVSEGEFQGVKKICEWASAKNILEKIEVLGFVDHTKSVDWTADAGCKVLNLLCKGSLKHLELQLKQTPDQHIENINKTIDYANSKGVWVNVYLEDASNGLMDSFDYVCYLIENIKGANRFMLPDTLGVWSPAETYDYLSQITAKYPDILFDFHAHNDYGLAVANSLAAIDAGITRVHTTVNGLGERAGNCPFASLVASIHDHTGFTTNIDEQHLTSLARLVGSMSGIRVLSNTPVVGENVYTQTCGVHADGDKKGNLYFNKLLPERFGGERNYALGKTSGKASIQKNLEILGIELDDESLKKVLKKVVELGDKKERITVSDLPYIISSVLGTPMETRVHLIDFELKLQSKAKPSATVTLDIDGTNYTKTASGDGQYDAFMKAVRLIYDQIDQELPILKDYFVVIPPGGKTDALVETIITWGTDPIIKTKGVDPDQTTAAIKATLNMLNQIMS